MDDERMHPWGCALVWLGLIVGSWLLVGALVWGTLALIRKARG